MQMERAGVIQGTIVDDIGTPLPGVNVTLGCELLIDKYDPQKTYNLSLYGQGGTRADAQGRYSFTNLPQFRNECEYRVYFKKEGYWAENKGFRTDELFGTRTVDMQLFEKHLVTVAGRVIDNQGRPVVCCRVSHSAHGRQVWGNQDAGSI
jgi:protocatechuate 3,4-dioxygenase beta subunit